MKQMDSQSSANMAAISASAGISPGKAFAYGCIAVLRDALVLRAEADERCSWLMRSLGYGASFSSHQSGNDHHHHYQHRLQDQDHHR